MAQSDLTIQNQSFPSFRSDLNDALTALNTTQSGTSRPSSAVAGTIWLDTTNATSPTLKLYDGGDDISLATLDYSANTVNWLDSTVSADLVNDTTPQLGGMLDVNGNAIGNGTEELIKFSETASAVNEVTVTNSATGNAPELSATGDDTNIDLKLTPKGSGNLVLDGIKFPNADGTSGQALQTDGSGNLSFASVGGTNTPAFSAVAASNQSISTTTITVINFGTELYDTDSAYDGTNKFTVPTGKDGKYLFNANARLDSLSDGDGFQLGFYVNGDANVGGENFSTISQQIAPSSAAIYFGITGIINLTAGDYVQVFIYQTGGTLSTDSGYVGFRGFKLIGV